jgi:hypothetical protein
VNCDKSCVRTIYVCAREARGAWLAWHHEPRRATRHARRQHVARFRPFGHGASKNVNVNVNKKPYTTYTHTPTHRHQHRGRHGTQHSAISSSTQTTLHYTIYLHIIVYMSWTTHKNTRRHVPTRTRTRSRTQSMQHTQQTTYTTQRHSAHAAHARTYNKQFFLNYCAATAIGDTRYAIHTRYHTHTTRAGAVAQHHAASDRIGIGSGGIEWHITFDCVNTQKCSRMLLPLATISLRGDLIHEPATLDLLKKQDLHRYIHHPRRIT